MRKYLLNESMRPRKQGIGTRGDAVFNICNIQ